MRHVVWPREEDLGVLRVPRIPHMAMDPEDMRAKRLT